MAVRLQMKLGVVAEADHIEDSPDTVAVVEPTIGATSRTKGSLYVVVAGSGRARRLQEATRLVADTVQGEYYYDESAGLVVCLEKAVRAANRRLAAQRERLGLGGEAGHVGLGVAVVRGSELYVATAGPVDAYLIHQAHLLTLPDPNADLGLPVEDLVPHTWRGELYCTTRSTVPMSMPSSSEAVHISAFTSPLLNESSASTRTCLESEP